MFRENTRPFFADFGIPVVIDGRETIGLFDSSYVDQLGAIDGNKASLTIPESEAARHGDPVRIDQRHYRIVSVQPENGLKTLILEAKK